MNDYLQTYSGGMMNLTTNDFSELTLEDIAHSLSNQCRYAGHTRHFYSVAQHCLICADNAPAGQEWNALMHDAVEAVITDIPSPVKARVPPVKDYEISVQSVLMEKFDYRVTTDVKLLDIRALATEIRDLMEPSDHQAWDWVKEYKPFDATIEFLPQSWAKDEFLAYAKRYKPEHVS